jgi:hypothetical protein
MSINFEYLNKIEGWLDPRAMIFSNYLKNYYLKDSFNSLTYFINAEAINKLFFNMSTNYILHLKDLV